MEAHQTTSITPPFNDEFEELIQREYGRLAAQGHTYLDYTGGNMYAQSQLDRHFSELSTQILGNPHSTNPTSALATEKVAAARQKVLDFFHADDYYCVFTQNASGALKIIGEDYKFEDRGRFVILADNHNSVNGIREYCRARGGSFDYAPIRFEDLRIDEQALKHLLDDDRPYGNKLFAFPAQSNVSGVQHDLKWIDYAQSRGWDVLLDAAAFVPSSPLNLTEHHPDFVTISFYKIFGYPTGIGCLLIRKSKFNRLQKRWFAGGTVTLAAVRSPHHYLTNNHERFENGTINYLDIPAVEIGIEHIQSIGHAKIHDRVTALSNMLYNALDQLTHTNGQKMVKLHGPKDRHAVGGTLIMNFFRADGSVIPFEEIEEQANARNISIRSGCFCNPGIDEVNNQLSEGELSNYFTHRADGNYKDMVAFLHKMRGATRVSFGLASRVRDVETFLEFVQSFRA
jgi:molybdenum cofactor sulfurtransferase